ncbi:MAG: hypothetical protein KatS3mg007_1970 [Thermoanaerobaculum sp.]|nr:MAG: hypothetical protein KatS3mg007_1970 [Thermoanaerobaculum sp.]
MNETMDQAKAEAFASRMMGLLNDAFVGILVSIGHQTHLFDTMAEMPAATSEAIAQATGLQERYVREWLGGMVVARIVMYDPPRKTYVVPREHAAFLTRSAGVVSLILWVKHGGADGPGTDEEVDQGRDQPAYPGWGEGCDGGGA